MKKIRIPIIFALMMMAFIMLPAGVYAAAEATISAPANNSTHEVGKLVTITARSSYEMPSISDGRVDNYVYYRVTRDGQTVHYSSKSYGLGGAYFGLDDSFTPDKKGRYKIEVQRHAEYVNKEYVPLLEEDFQAQSSVEIIVQQPIKDAQITDLVAKQYTGEAITQNPVVKCNGETLTEGIDYDLSYSNNVEVGTGATVTVKGKGFYKGTVSANFEIKKADVYHAQVNGLIDQTYTSQAITPKPDIVLNGKTLVEGTDYELAYSNNVDIGTATIMIAGKGTYYWGNRTATFKITQRDISEAEVSGVNGQYYYTGNPIKPDGTLSYNGKTLTKGTDYDVEYKNNTNLGQATIKFKGKGNLKGEKDTEFSIVEPTATGGSVTIHSPANGKEFKTGEEVTVKASSKIYKYAYYMGNQLPGAPNYIYVKVTRNGTKVLYERREYTTAGTILQWKFTPTVAGTYQIQACYHEFAYSINGSTLSYSPIPYESFTPGVSININVKNDSGSSGNDPGGGNSGGNSGGNNNSGSGGTSVVKKAQSVGKTTIRNTIANTVANPKYKDVLYDAVPGATSYDIAYKHRNSKKWVVKNVGKTTKARITGLSIGGFYEIKVRARKAGNAKYKAAVGAWSPTVNRYFYTTQKIRLKSDSKGSFTMSWAGNPTATGYQVMFTDKSNGAGAAKNINTIGKTGTSFTKKGLKSGKTYYVQVRTLKKIGATTYVGNISRPIAVKIR